MPKRPITQKIIKRTVGFLILYTLFSSIIGLSITGHTKECEDPLHGSGHLLNQFHDGFVLVAALILLMLTIHYFFKLMSWLFE